LKDVGDGDGSVEELGNGLRKEREKYERGKEGGLDLGSMKDKERGKKKGGRDGPPSPSRPWIGR
jgi:hypothetical protein